MVNLSTVDLFKNIGSENSVEVEGELLLKLQECLLSIVDDIDYVCRKYDIFYVLGGGSALGAIRHGGFIPWDDDIDINMPRDEFRRLACHLQEEFEGKYTIQDPETTEGYNLLLGRIRLNGTKYVTKEDFDAKPGQTGVFIDVFFIENTYDSAVLRKLHGFFSLAAGLALSCRRFYRDRKNLEKILTTREAKKVLFIKSSIGFIFSFLKVSTLIRIADKIHSVCKNKNSKYITIPVGRKHFFGELYERDKICRHVFADFDGRKLPVPEAYDAYLKNLYGNYLAIPEKDKREKHFVLDIQL